MEKVLLVIHMLIALAMIGVIMLQRSEGGGLGIGGGGGLGGMMSARGTANLLTRTTSILAGCFMFTSIVLAILAGHHTKPASIVDGVAAPTAPASGPATGGDTGGNGPSVPAVPVAPVAPVSQ